MGAGEHLAIGIERASERGLEKQPLDPLGIAVEQGLHRSEPANSQQLTFVQWTNRLLRTLIARARPH